MDLKIIRQPFRYRNYNVVYWLIGINLLIFLAANFLGRDINRFLTIHLSMIPAAIVEYRWIWTFVTYMFMHGNFSHIFFNMFGLFIFGTRVEREMGSREFLLFYLVTGSLAGVF